VVNMFHKSLDDNGYLLMGHSETLDRVSDDFSPIIIGDAFAYVKTGSNGDASNQRLDWLSPADALNRSDAGKVREVEVHKESTQSREQDERLEEISSFQPIKDVELIYKEGLELCEREEFDAALDKAEIYIESRPTAAKGYLLAGKVYANRALYEQAVEKLERSIEFDPLLTEAHYILGVICQGARKTAKAIEEFKKSIYIDGDCVLSHFNLACIYQANGMAEDASREYNNALKILWELQADEIIKFSDGITARILIQTCLKNNAEQ